MRKTFISVITGIIIFFIFINVGNVITGPVVCEDGWRSSLIGKQGACSHHGGVDNTAQNFVGIISVVAGIFSGFYLLNFLEEKQTKKERGKYLEEHKNDPICPTHNVHMVKRFGKYGEFWGCSRYPYCKITKDIDKDVVELNSEIS